MLEQAAFQRDFLRSIDHPLPGGSVLGVYRNTALLGSISAIADNFPTVTEIIGHSAMEAIAAEFVEACPPSSPILVGYGAQFPHWLADHPIARDLPYLAAVAEIDRLHTEAHIAEDAPEFGLDGLAAISADEWTHCKIRLHPATRLGWYPVPAPSIWVAHLDPEFGEIEPAWKAEGILVTRRMGAVSGFVIDACEHRILHGLRVGETVGQAALAASDLYPAGNISRAFRRIVESGALTTPTIKGRPS